MFYADILFTVKHNQSMAQRHRNASVLRCKTVTGRAVPTKLHLSLQSWCGIYFHVCTYQLSYVGRRSAQKG